MYSKFEWEAPISEAARWASENESKRKAELEMKKKYKKREKSEKKRS